MGIFVPVEQSEWKVEFHQLCLVKVCLTVFQVGITFLRQKLDVGFCALYYWG